MNHELTIGLAIGPVVMVATMLVLLFRIVRFRRALKDYLKQDADDETVR